jgi:CRP-like cAMP-binding protein
MELEFSLKDVVMFSQLTDEALEEVRAALQARRLETGEILFNQGDPGDELILVNQGRVAIFAPVEGAPGGGQPIRFFQAGELLGEMALIDRKPRSLSARAEETSLVFTLNGDQFRDLLEANPEMALSVMGGLNDRIRYTTDFLSEVRQWVRRMADGSYQGERQERSDKYKDKTLSTLAAEFAQMAAKVQEREETLKKEVAQLRIEIDEARRKKEASQIMDSDYYRSLKEKVKALRRQSEEQD